MLAPLRGKSIGNLQVEYSEEITFAPTTSYFKAEIESDIITSS